MQQDELFQLEFEKHEKIQAGDLVFLRKSVGNIFSFEALRFNGIPGYVINVEKINSVYKYHVFFGTEILECEECELMKKE